MNLVGPAKWGLRIFLLSYFQELSALGLSKQGRSDQEIARVIAASSSIAITADQIGQYYAAPEDWHQYHEQRAS